MKVVFNTGRLYQAEGQVITTQLVDDHILFTDHSRGIAGRIEILDPERVTTENILIRFTMREYDAGRFKWAPAVSRDMSVTPTKVRV